MMASLPESPNLAFAMAAAAAASAGHRAPGDYYANMMSKLWNSAGILSPPGENRPSPHHLSLESLRFSSPSPSIPMEKPGSGILPSPSCSSPASDKIHPGLNNNSFVTANKNNHLLSNKKIASPPNAHLPRLSGAAALKAGQITCNCGTTFPNLEVLERHMIAHHPENTNLLCAICQKQFPNFTKLQRHMTNHDDSPNLRKFKCNRCGKAFKFKHHLKEHERIHTGEKPFECKHCGKRFSHSGSYSSHTTSKKCLQLGRRPNPPGSSVGPPPPPIPISQPQQAPLLFGGSNSGGSTSPSVRPPAFHHQVKGPRDGMPLSPPLTPLPSARFPPPGVNLLPPPYPATHQPSHLHSFLLAAAQTQGYNPLLGPRPNHLEFVENLQRYIQMRNNMVGAPLLGSKEEEEEEIEEKSSDNNILVVEEEEEETGQGMGQFLQREEELVEDEMKEEELDDDEEQPPNKQHREDVTHSSENVDAIKQQLQEQARLVMMKKFLENVNAESQRLEEGSCGEDLPDGISDSSVVNIPCKFDCGKKFKSESLGDLLIHQENCDSLCDDQDSQDGMAASGGSADERKVRVRTLISEEQLGVLKTYYTLNPRPKREELEKIAAEIGHPFKVVKVWFQNSRARDRREGKPLNPYGNGETPQIMAGLLSRVSAVLQHNNNNNNNRKCDSKTPDSTLSEKSNTYEDQPLDLSNKGSSPSASPASQTKDEALNLSSSSMPLFPILPSSLSSLQDIYKLREIEEDAGGYVCPKCNKSFNKQTALAKHCSVEHSDSRPYQCDFCDKAFKHKHHLSEHKRLHTGEKPFQCSQCHKRFSHSGSYSQHINHRYKSCKPLIPNSNNNNNQEVASPGRSSDEANGRTAFGPEDEEDSTAPSAFDTEEGPQ